MPPQNQQPSPSGPPGGPQQPTPAPSRPLLIWWFILTALLVWNLSVFWDKTTAEQAVEIPYTTFLAEAPTEPPAVATAAPSPAPEASEKPMAVTATAPTARSVPPAASGTRTGGTPESTKKTTPAQHYSRFETVFPEAIGDASLMSLLEAHDVQVSAEPPQTHWLMSLLIEGLPLILLVGLFVYMGRRAGQAQTGGILGFGRTKARRYIGEQTRVTFE